MVSIYKKRDGWFRRGFYAAKSGLGGTGTLNYFYGHTKLFFTGTSAEANALPVQLPFSDLPPQFLDNTEVCYNIWMECQRNSPRRPVAMVFFQILIEANSNYLQQIVPTQSTQIHCICIH